MIIFINEIVFCVYVWKWDRKGVKNNSVKFLRRVLFYNEMMVLIVWKREGFFFMFDCGEFWDVCNILD